MTLFNFACPACQYSFKVRLADGMDRGKITCPQCQTSFVVTAPTQTETQAEEEDASLPPSSASITETPPISSEVVVPTAELVSEGAVPPELPSRSATISSATNAGPEATIASALQPYAPPTAAVSVATERACPLCGRSDKKYLVSGKVLYDHKVCRKCFNSFLNRRQLAFLLDIVLFTVIVLFINYVGGFIVGFLIAYSTGEVTEEDLATIEGMFTLFNYGLYFFWYLLKDGFRGASLGKALTGIRVIDDTTGQPIGFGKSARRNWPIVLLGLVPFAWLIIGATMGKGYRIGDRAAKTKVIWKKYQQNPVFQPKHRSTTAVSALTV